MGTQWEWSPQLKQTPDSGNRWQTIYFSILILREQNWRQIQKFVHQENQEPKKQKKVVTPNVSISGNWIIPAPVVVRSTPGEWKDIFLSSARSDRYTNSLINRFNIASFYGHTKCILARIGNFEYISLLIAWVRGDYWVIYQRPSIHEPYLQKVNFWKMLSKQQTQWGKVYWVSKSPESTWLNTWLEVCKKRIKSFRNRIQ